MYRNVKTRIFGEPASVSEKKPTRGNTFLITLDNDVKEINTSKQDSDSVEVKLVQFARSGYGKFLAKHGKCDEFIKYCLTNIYHIKLEDTVRKYRGIVDGKVKVKFDVLALGEILIAAGMIAVVEVYIADEPDPDQPGPAARTDIGKAAILCGGKEFGNSVEKRMCDLIKMEIED